MPKGQAHVVKPHCHYTVYNTADTPWSALGIYCDTGDTQCTFWESWYTYNFIKGCYFTCETSCKDRSLLYYWALLDFDMSTE